MRVINENVQPAMRFGQIENARIEEPVSYTDDISKTIIFLIKNAVLHTQIWLNYTYIYILTLLWCKCKLMMHQSSREVDLLKMMMVYIATKAVSDLYIKKKS